MSTPGARALLPTTAPSPEGEPARGSHGQRRRLLLWGALGTAVVVVTSACAVAAGSDPSTAPADAPVQAPALTTTPGPMTPSPVPGSSGRSSSPSPSTSLPAARRDVFAALEQPGPAPTSVPVAVPVGAVPSGAVPVAAVPVAAVPGGGGGAPGGRVAEPAGPVNAPTSRTSPGPAPTGTAAPRTTPAPSPVPHAVPTPTASFAQPSAVCTAVTAAGSSIVGLVVSAVLNGTDGVEDGNLMGVDVQTLTAAADDSTDPTLDDLLTRLAHDAVQLRTYLLAGGAAAAYDFGTAEGDVRAADRYCSTVLTGPGR